MFSMLFRLSGLALVLALVSTVLSAWVGPLWAMAAVCALLLVLILHDNVMQQRLLDWLQFPQRDLAPRAFGTWGEIFYRSARQQRLWSERVEREQGKLTRFIEALQASPNGVMLLDRGDQIDWFNDTAADHFGLEPERDLRQHAVNLIRNPEFVTYMAARSFEQPLQLRRSGRLGSQLLSVQVIPYGEGDKLLLSRDITQGERTEAMRRDFVANVSHEIRTPLTVIAGFIESLRTLELAAAEREHVLELMQAQSDRMKHLVEDLLTLAHLEGDPHQPAEDVIDMPAMVQRLQVEANVLSGGQHRIVASADAANLRGCHSELTSAFTNLVSNAVRYSPKGGDIAIAWKVHELDSGGEPWGEFSVRDSGLGIAAEHIPRLTERFYRVDRGRSRETGGTGLGLAIVKHVLLRHHAELRIDSQLGQGSTFSARFPAQRLLLPKHG